MWEGGGVVDLHFSNISLDILIHFPLENCSCHVTLYIFLDKSSYLAYGQDGESTSNTEGGRMVTNMCIPELVLPVSSIVLFFAIPGKLCVPPPVRVCLGWGQRFLICGLSAFLSFIASHI